MSFFKQQNLDKVHQCNSSLPTHAELCGWAAPPFQDNKGRIPPAGESPGAHVATKTTVGTAKPDLGRQGRKSLVLGTVAAQRG